MEYGSIITRLETVIDAIEYEEISIKEIHTVLIELVNDIESEAEYDADFESLSFDDLD